MPTSSIRPHARHSAFAALLMLGAAILGGCNSSNEASADTAGTSTSLTTTGTTGTATAAASVYKDVAYASSSSAQQMDVYVPSGSGPFPAVVLIHGGAFMMGDKSGESANIAALNARGFVAVSINYRLSKEAAFPAAVQDCKTAVRFLRAHATDYRINPDKIGAWGASAGGNLAAMLGTSAGVAELEGAELGNADKSSRVQAVVDWFGPINFLTMDDEASALGFTLNTNAATSPESRYIGAAVQTVPAQVAKANPATYASADDAAFFIQVGSADSNIPYTQSANFYQTMRTAKGASSVQYELLDGAGHGTSEFGSTANLQKVLAFLDQTLR